MVENLGCCGLLQTCCHRDDPQKYIIEGTFEIDHSPWLSLCATSVSVRLYSQDKADPITEKGIESENAYIMNGKVSERKKHTTKCMNVATKVIKFKLKIEVVQDFGLPGAFVVENRNTHEFFLKSAALHYINHPMISKEKSIHFYCASWVYPINKTGNELRRIFFTDQLYLPKNTPQALQEVRKRELRKIRGGSKDERKPWDRIYEYDCYNDLGDPDNSRQFHRPVLGNSPQYPYPRRLRTGRPPCRHDPLAESRPASCWRIYVPPDEQLSDDKQKELKDNFVDALFRFLTPNSNQQPMLNQKLPDFLLKIGHFFVPNAALSMEDCKFIQPIVNLFRRKPKPSAHQDPSSSDVIKMVENIFADKQVKELEESVRKELQELVPNEIFKQIVATAAATERKCVSSQIPSIIAEDIYAWADNKEFGRQMLAGTNPVRIRRLLEKDLSVLRKKCNWLRDFLEKAMSDEKKLFILEHHDYLEPFLKMINGKGVCAYATRTILEVDDAGSTYDTIVPVAIELSLLDDSYGDSMVLRPDDDIRWELAKMHVATNDAAYHQLVSHWLHTHAIVEPFIIGTRRQLSVMHPIHRLLDPHFKDTLHINALARTMFLNAGGILETTLFTGEFSMRLSSHLYKQWRFDEQALPADLLKRGMALATKKTEEKEKTIRDENVSSEIIKMPTAEKELEIKADEEVVGPVEVDENPIEIHEDVVELDDTPVKTNTRQPADNEFDAGVNLVLEDYPYAKDGLEIWVAIETWVMNYCKIFYKTDMNVEDDTEIQEWWSEIRNVGHADQKQGWYDIKSLKNLVKALTTLIWITTGLHAAVNFGQYGYNGWPLNRPMLLRKFVPRENDAKELEDVEKFVNQMLPEKFQMEFVIAVMDVLSRHTSDEVYLGQTSSGKKWGMDEIDKKFDKFKENLMVIEKNIKARNKEYGLMNRWGYAKIPYKLLYPDTSKTMPFPRSSKEKGKHDKMDINERGIPNSISI